MAPRVRWSSPALYDLVNILEIGKEDPVSAHRYAEKFEEVVRQLVDFPRTGRVVPEYGDECIRERIVPPFRLVYRLESPEELIVVRVHHSTQQLPGEI